MPLQEMEQLQGDLLRQTVDYAAAASPYYRERLSATYGYAASVKSLSDLRALPLTTREDIQGRNGDFQAAAADHVVEIVATTGTTGAPIIVPMTAGDVERLAEGERRGLQWLGARPGDRFHVAVTLDNLFVAGLAYQAGLHRLGAAAIRVGAQPSRRHLDLIRELRPDGMVAVPSHLLALARQAEIEAVDLKEFAPMKFLLIGEATRERDMSPNRLGRLVSEAWSGTMHSTYGLTEAGLAFHECPARQGVHAHPDLVLCEIVDEDGAVLPPGAAGELAITTLQVEGMPLLRYRTGDITFLLSGRCPCGRNGPRLGPVLGRKQQRMKFKGTTLYPKVFEEALLSVDGVDNFLVEVHHGEGEWDRVVVRVGTSRDDPCFKKRLSDILYSKARVTPEVCLESPFALERLIFDGGRRKPRTFIDFRDRG